MHSFERIAALPDVEIELAVGAALIARDVHPGLSVDDVVRRLDDLALPLRARARDLERATAADQAAAMAQHLFVEMGFRGNEDDYYDPKNSLISDVLARRIGNPITLAVIYLEVARRVGVDASGVAFPGHFLVRIERRAAANEAPGALLVDPFFAGRLLSGDELLRLLQRIPGESALRPEHTAPASRRMILVRMLTNLKSIYVSRGDLARAYLATDRIVTLTPDSAAAVRARGQLAAKLSAVAAAHADFTRALELDPSSSDAAETRAALAELPQPRSLLN